MATVTTINIPTYAVRETVRTVLFAFGELTDAQQELAFKEVQKATRLESTVQIPCASGGEASNLVDLFNRTGPLTTVEVDSFTRYGVSYLVQCRGSEPVSCDCPDFVNRSKSDPNHVCKHMGRVEHYPNDFGLG